MRKPLIGGLSLCLGLGLVAGAFAQEDDARYRLTVSQGIKWSDNPTFRASGNDSSFLGTSQLSFGIKQGNRRNQFSLTAGVGVEYELDGSDSRMLGPNVTLGYAHESKDTRVAVSASARRQQLFELATTQDFDEDDLSTSSSTRDDLQFSATLETGRRDRFGTEWTISRRQRIYSNSSNSDTSTDRFSGALRFDWTHQISSRLSYNQQSFRTEDPNTNDRDTTTIALDNSLQINKVTQLTLGVNYTLVERSRPGAESDFDGFSYTAGLSLDRPLGAITLNFSDRFTETGRRQNLTIGRNLKQKWGSVSGRVGVSRSEGGKVQPLYNLELERKGKSNSFTASLSQQIFVTTADEDVLRSRLNLAYQQEINSRSGFSARIGLQDSRNLDRDNDKGRLSGSLSYTHRVGEDWGLAAGVSHTSVFDSDGDDTTRNEVFMRLEKDFIWR